MNYSKLTKKELITILELRDKPVNVGSTGDAFSFLRKYGKEQQEYFFVLMLDGALKIKNVKIVSIGLANRTLVHPREVFAPAIEARCVSIIIAHKIIKCTYLILSVTHNILFITFFINLSLNMKKHIIAIKTFVINVPI